jgi:hypothetical protein
MNIEEKKEQREILVKQSRELMDKHRGVRDAINKVEQSIAEELCPFKTGDRIETSAGGECFVADISYRSYGNPFYHFTIRKIKKDGTPYAETSRTYLNPTDYMLVVSDGN